MVVGEVLAAVPEVAAGLIHYQLSDARVGNTLYSASAGQAVDAATASATTLSAATASAATPSTATPNAATAAGRLLSERALA